MVKAIFINSDKKEITEVNLSKKNTLRETYDLIGNGCELVQTGAYLIGNDAVMVDEEGYFKEGLSGFYLRDRGYFYGNAVVWGCDEEGEHADCETPIEKIKAGTTWVDEILSAEIRVSVLDQPSTINVVTFL